MGIFFPRVTLITCIFLELFFLLSLFLAFSWYGVSANISDFKMGRGLSWLIELLTFVVIGRCNNIGF